MDTNNCFFLLTLISAVWKGLRQLIPSHKRQYCSVRIRVNLWKLFSSFSMCIASTRPWPPMLPPPIDSSSRMAFTSSSRLPSYNQNQQDATCDEKHVMKKIKAPMQHTTLIFESFLRSKCCASSLMKACTTACFSICNSTASLSGRVPHCWGQKYHTYIKVQQRPTSIYSLFPRTQ